ncbi:MAG: hypothetical protein IJC97_04385 [Oscillospiraceae bacterium]|nr:hypothetical protein [Oscillospiraceae bacterium]
MDNNKKKIPIDIFIISILFAIAGSVSISVISTVNIFNNKFKNVSKYKQISAKIYELDEIVKNKYNGTIDDNKLNDELRLGYMNGIADKNSRYITKDEYIKIKKGQQGQKALFGAELIADGGYIKVKKYYNKSFNETNELEPGDLIININGEDITTENVKEHLTNLWQLEGKAVDITIRRGVNDINKNIVVRCVDILPVESESFDNIGYIKFQSFNNRAANDFEKQLENILKEEDAVIFDVRGVSSGDVECAAKMLQFVLPQGLIVSSVNKDNTSENLFYSSGKKELKKPAVVLADNETAGAAELFVAALKSYNKALFVGAQTTGRGAIQETFELKDGSAVELTTAEFLPPNGISFHEKGLVPDVSVESMPVQDIGEQSTFSQSDLQLLKAIEILKNILENNTTK